jgi:hypothetical protein
VTLTWLRRPALLGALSGLVYGLVARMIADHGMGDPLGGFFGVMTWTFLLVVPLVIGYLTVRPHPQPSWTFRLVAPWAPVLLSVLISWLVGWEGAICIVMGLPLLLVLSSVGGMIGAALGPRRNGPGIAIALLPLLLGPLERQVAVPTSLRRVETSIPIDAPAARVWSQIIEVPEIQPAERRPALFTRMGFPAPTSAVLTRHGVGGVRLARFEGGVLFVETITDWQPDRLLRFTIRAETDSIPVTTLDRHVVVGGPYFEVLTGTYWIEPAGHGVILHLASELRVSTRFNFYAGRWADLIMRSIQQNILQVIKRRAEEPGHWGSS